MDTSGRTIDRVPPRWDHDPPLAHGVAHRLPGGRGADPLPPRLSAYRRPQPDPRERPRTGRHAPDRAQEPRHLRPLQHYSRAGTARRRGPAGRLSGAAGAGGASPAAASPGRTRRPAHRITPPPRTTRHRVRAHGPPAPARGRGRQWPDTARLCAAAHAGVGARIETGTPRSQPRCFIDRQRRKLGGPCRSSHSAYCTRAALRPFSHRVSWLEDHRR